MPKKNATSDKPAKPRPKPKRRRGGNGDDQETFWKRHCAFCGRDPRQAAKVFSGYNALICDDCVRACHALLTESAEAPTTETVDRDKLPRPEQIVAHLSEYVIGQEDAKRHVAVAVYNHYKRIFYPEWQQDVELDKSNILLIGPTGTGKTLLAQTLARMLHVPFCIADATVLTEAGYVGEDVENILVRLLQAADYDQDRAERGIVYIDELDKISRRDANPSITRDVSGEGVQQGLLKILEGTVANVPPKGGRKHPEQSFVHLDTKNILFICGGAFHGLEKVVQRRIGKKTVGFHSDPESVAGLTDAEVLGRVEPEDLIEYGLIPELVGRLPIVTALEELSTEAMLAILTEPKNALIKQFTTLFAMENVELEFEPAALDEIVKLARKRKTGARGLRAILETALGDAMYRVPSIPRLKKVVVTPETILGRDEPRMHYTTTKKKSA